MKAKLPKGFVPLSHETYKRLNDAVTDCLVDASCFAMWIDGFEYELRNYLSDKAYESLNGFASSLINRLNFIERTCHSLDFSLLL